jgi:hypothetical protein
VKIYTGKQVSTGNADTSDTGYEVWTSLAGFRGYNNEPCSAVLVYGNDLLNNQAHNFPAVWQNFAINLMRISGVFPELEG